MIFIPAFQPIKHVGKGSFVAAEVLARWYDEGKVIVPHNIKFAVYRGLVDIEVATFIQNNFPFCGGQYRALFINVSEQTISADRIFQAWVVIINRIVINWEGRIFIEIIEGVQDTSLADRWDALANLGGEFALDDYGDDHSTMTRLNQYSWRYCKFQAKKLHTLVDCPAVQYYRDNGVQIISEQIETPLQEENAKLFWLFLQQGLYHEKSTVLEEYMHRAKAIS